MCTEFSLCGSAKTEKYDGPLKMLFLYLQDRMGINAVGTNVLEGILSKSSDIIKSRICSNQIWVSFLYNEHLNCAFCNSPQASFGECATRPCALSIKDERPRVVNT